MEVEKFNRFIFNRKGLYFAIRLIDIPFWDQLCQKYFSKEEVVSSDRVDCVNGIFPVDFHPLKFASYFDLTVRDGKFPLFQLTNFTFEDGMLWLVESVVVYVKDGKVVMTNDVRVQDQLLHFDNEHVNFESDIEGINAKLQKLVVQEPKKEPVIDQIQTTKYGQRKRKNELIEALIEDMARESCGSPFANKEHIYEKLSRMFVPQLREECKKRGISIYVDEAEKKDQTVYLYVLSLQEGFYYVGRSEDVEKRFQQHVSGQGAQWTRIHDPLEVVEVRRAGSTPGLEEDLLVKQLMQEHGIGKVRGGSYSNEVLEPIQIRALNMELNHSDGRCVRCGRASHFVTQCYARTDVNGKLI